MKKLLLTLGAFVSVLTLHAQESGGNAETPSVEKSVFGIQTGFVGLWIHHEMRLTSQIALRSELGLDLGYWYSDGTDTEGYFVVPGVTLEPRWYYNLKKRISKNRRIDSNSGNYLSLRASFYPDMVVASSEDDLRFVPQFFCRPDLGHSPKHRKSF